MTKRSKKSLKSENDLNDRQDSQRKPQRWTENDARQEREKMIERRLAQTEGVEICPKCGGVVWNLQDRRRCGDCFCDF